MNFDSMMLIISGVCSFFGYMKQNDISVKVVDGVQQILDSAVREKFYEEESVARTAMNDAAREYNVFTQKEQNDIQAQLVNNASYQQAKTTSEAASRKVQELKKALKNYKSNSTQVAVGSGKSAVAVNVVDDSGKIQLQTSLAEANAELQANQNLVNDIYKTTKAKVVEKRTPEFYQAQSKMNSTKTIYNDILLKKEEYRTQLKNDRTFMSEALKKNAYHYNKGEVIACAALQSALPVYILYRIWSTAITKIQYVSMVN